MVKVNTTFFGLQVALEYKSQQPKMQKNKKNHIQVMLKCKSHFWEKGVMLLNKSSKPGVMLWSH